MASVQVEGEVAPGFEGVRKAFQANFDTGADVGASVTVTKDGAPVVDIWGGFADEAGSRPWQRDTIINVYSTTKTMTALVALLLADKGELDFDTPVARYWPEFAANGKADVKVSHLMSHSAGLATWKEPLKREDVYDWEKMCALLAAQAPDWEPGSQPGYHALTQGYLVGEVIRRIDGRTVGTVFREEIAEPLGADFHIGLPASEDGRVADLIPPPVQPMAGESNPPIEVLDTRTRAWRGAEIPAAGGTGNARSVALVHMILANGGEAMGKRFMSEAGVRKALEPQVEGVDRFLGIPVRYGMGFGLPGKAAPMPSPNTIYWGGYGGSLALIDMDQRTTIAYVMNKMAPTTTGDMRGFGVAMSAWEALGLI